MTKSKKKTGGAGKQADGTRRSYFVFDPHEVVIIGIDTNDPEPGDPLFDPDSNAHPAEKDEGSIANVRTYGVLEPILFERRGDAVVVVDGRTRVRWARCAAKLQKAAGEEVLVVPGIPKRGTADMLYGYSRAANLRRPEESDLSKARQAQRALDMNGGSEQAAATAFGVTVQTLRKWLALLSLDPKVQRLVERGMSTDAAAKLAKLPRKDQVAKVEQLKAEGAKPTARAVANRLRADSGKAPTVTPRQRIDLALNHISSEARTYANAETRDALNEVARILFPGWVDVDFDEDPDATRNNGRPGRASEHAEDFES